MYSSSTVATTNCWWGDQNVCGRCPSLEVCGWTAGVWQRARLPRAHAEGSRLQGRPTRFGTIRVHIAPQTKQRQKQNIKLSAGLTKAGYVETSSKPTGVSSIPSKSLPIPTLDKSLRSVPDHFKDMNLCNHWLFPAIEAKWSTWLATTWRVALPSGATK